MVTSSIAVTKRKDLEHSLDNQVDLLESMGDCVILGEAEKLLDRPNNSLNALKTIFIDDRVGAIELAVAILFVP